jgi:uncharacterized coiled-coil DUF342 family protein
MDNEEGTPRQQNRERIGRWLEEGAQLFPMLPALLDGDDQARTRLDTAERETERLRKEVEELRRENGELRTERDEIARTFSKLMETAQPMNQIAQRLGLKRSPFERAPKEGG